MTVFLTLDHSQRLLGLIIRWSLQPREGSLLMMTAYAGSQCEACEPPNLLLKRSLMMSPCSGTPWAFDPKSSFERCCLGLTRCEFYIDGSKDPYSSRYLAAV